VVHTSDVVFHPDIAARHAGKHLAGFVDANETVHVRIAEQPRYYSWSMFVRQNGVGGVNYERRLVFDTAVLAVQYVLSGEGVALVDPALSARRSGAVGWFGRLSQCWTMGLGVTWLRSRRRRVIQGLRCFGGG
jgi:DNA-binding transcriptional LysR family regulator